MKASILWILVMIGLAGINLAVWTQGHYWCSMWGVGFCCGVAAALAILTYDRVT